ncbi:MAG: transglutaminase domain-containing protein [Desulfuromonadaceae bacterium]|nr:transglutaminase domain-containing protein [Desulfuromonadaceae bacterium]MDD5107649.1 transglutaminase domain-containing protein [Desulfuromonadaceae bacterium]
MFRKHSRIIAAVVLGFFTWTSGGVFSIAHAAVDAAKKGKAVEAAKKQAEGPEERFAKLTGDLEETLADPKGDVDKKRQRLTAGKTEMETLDVDIRKQFAETEKKLKDAKLSPEILERHRKFVKHYDDNLSELKGNIERVEKAKGQAEVEIEIEKTRKHLERVKAPSRHQKLDPNNLPHRQPKANKREPRMKKEEFEKDLKKDKHAWKNAKRIQVASIGSLAGLLASSSINAIAPTADDLAETIEVQFTPEIKAKALELGNNPVKIYEWVRNNIEFVPTWGSIQGAQMTMLTKQGNAFDSSSLLIALLRAAGISARYVTGTIELPIDKIMNWAGGFTDPMSALDFMSSGGIPTKGLTSGGKVVAARFEHVWVEAFINYIPFRGAKHVNGKGDTWIKLDPSYKQNTYTAGIDVKSAVPFDAQAFLTQIQSSATINEAQGYVTGVNSLATQQAMQDYQTRVQSYIQQNYPNATVGDVLGKKEIVKKEYPHLLGTLPYRTAVKGATFATIPDTLRQKLSFNVKNDTSSPSIFDYSIVDPDAPASVDNSLNISKSLAELAGKKITLSYSPATPQDEAIINAYLPTPHADGTPIQPSELPSQLPAYLINVKPELRIDGQVVATGEPIGLGGTNIFTMTFSDPAYGSSQVTNYIDAGVYQAIGLNLGRISQEQLTALKTKLEATKTKLQNSDFTNLTKDDLIGDLLHTTAMAYHAELGTMNYITARTMNVNAITLPSETIFATKLRVLTLWGIPRWVQSGGLNMDADYLMQVVKPKDGNADTARNYMLSSGMTSSALEHSVPEQLFSTPDNKAEGISTVKALKIANDQGIPIYTVNQSNIATTLPQLQIDQQTKDDIANAVNAGKVVTVSKTNITFNGWIGCGYIITNPETGAGAYMISGGGNGAMFGVNLLWGAFTLVSILLMLSGLAELAFIFSLITSVIISGLQTLISNQDVSDINWLTTLGLPVAGTGIMNVLLKTMTLNPSLYPVGIVCSLLIMTYIFIQSLSLHSLYIRTREDEIC